MPFLRERRRRPEVMDRPDLPAGSHVRALRGLARLNFWSGSARILWPPIRDLARQRPGQALRVLDLATGAGDVPVRLWRRACRTGLDLAIDACDLSPLAVEHARRVAARAGAGVRFFVHDALHGPPLTGYDAVVSSLFLHHLDEGQACAFLRRMADGARHLVLVNDLERGLAGLTLAHVATRLLTRSP